MAVGPAPFDLLGPLPSGTTVLEASAGTGKTFTIAGLVTRYVAEGVAMVDELLVVTFGRAATQELRDRVRERLVATRDALRDPATARGSGDDLVRFLADTDDAEVRERHARLTVALASFDAATVATMHEFCQRMLVTLGVTADLDPDATLVERFDDLTNEAVDDLYLRKWAKPGNPVFSLAAARDLARAVINDGQAVLAPDPDDLPADTEAGVRVRFAHAVRTEVERRKRRARVLGFDDWLVRLRDALLDPRTSAATTARLREKYRIVLVDEFQDTDPVQWDILRAAFHRHATLVLIGDPKQAIYAFRGADVYAYLAATEDADHVATLAQNWRSDPDLLRGLDAIFRGAQLGDPRISVASVTAAYRGRSLDVVDAPVRLRVVGRGKVAKLAAAAARELAVADVVAEIVRLLDEAPTLRPRDGSPARPLQPGDVAVIVKTNEQLDDVHTALLAAGVPSVQRSTRSVFRTAAASDWIVLLDALEQPHRRARIRRLAVTPFVGWDAGRLVDEDVDALALRVRYWLARYTDRGVAALFEAISRDERLAARLLGKVEGERRLTDLRHLAEALHAESISAGLGLTALLEWLRRRVRESDDDGSVERSRRLDSDAAAVQLVTTWASKGLEFPVVLVPFDWNRHLPKIEIPLFHEPPASPGGSIRRVRNVGGRTTDGFAADTRRDRDEKLGEDLRLLYVALTRAQSQLIVWWVPSDWNTPSAPLHRVLFAADPAAEVPDRAPVPSDARALAAIGALAVDGALQVEQAVTRPATRRTTDAAVGQELAAARFDRTVDTAWRRSSYTALTAGAHAATPQIGSEPEDTAKDDEPPVGGAPDSVVPDGAGPPDGTGEPAVRADELREVVSPMDSLPGGAAFGTLVHAVLEELDPTSADLGAALHDGCAAALARFGPADLAADVLAPALVPAITTPLGALADELGLADIAPTDRLAELEFELPLAGGDRPSGARRLSALGEVLRAHLPAGDPFGPYADMLDEPVLGDTVLEGYLTGSIDAVLRVGGRFVVVDYKTNRLGAPGEVLTAWDYRADALHLAMRQAHYPLQALLYQVALHRYLRWRLADYEPGTHLGGALYLFLRGMCGAGVRFADGSVPGVVAWRPPAALVVAASEVLAGGHDG